MLKFKNQKSLKNSGIKYCFGFRNSNFGFSLLELLVYISILLIATTLLVGVFMSISRSRGQSEARSEVNSNLRFAFDKISQDIKTATQISIPAAAGDTSTSISLTSGGNTVTYCIASNQLRRQVGGACNDASEAVTSDKVIVESILFSRIENSNAALSKTIINIKASMQIKYNSSSPDWQFTSSKTTSISVK